MLRTLLFSLLLLAGLRLGAAERAFDFGKYPLNETPKGFQSLLTGQGRPGEWKVIEDEVPPMIAPISARAPVLTRRPVLAQLSRDATDERFPLLVFDEETFGDFVLTTRFKIVRGAAEQMAGVAFRIQNEKSYYYVRASALGNNVRFFKVVDGVRSVPIGSDVQVATGVWHELTIECKGNRISCLLNGKDAFPPLNDNSFSTGKIAYWTKSDSVAYFVDTRMVYTPREILAQTIVRDVMTKYPRLVGLKIYKGVKEKLGTTIVASNDAAEVKQAGDVASRSVVEGNSTYYGKENQTATVTMPLHDRNGEVVGAVRVLMQSFRGQTEQNAVARALPIVQQIESRFRTAKDLLE